MENMICKNWTQWLIETRFAFLPDDLKAQTMRWLELVRDVVLINAELKEGETVIDIGTGTGLLSIKALEQLNGTGLVIFSDKFKDCLDSCEEFLKSNGITQGYKMLLAPCEDLGLPAESVDKALMRSVLVHIVDKQPAINEICRVLKKGGKFSAFEPIIASNTKYWEITSPEVVENYEKFKVAETEFSTNPNDPLCNFDEHSLAENLDKAGFSDGSVNLETVESKYTVTDGMVEKWFTAPPSPDQLSVKDRFLKYFEEPVVDKYIRDVERNLLGQEISIKTNAVFINAIK